MDSESLTIPLKCIIGHLGILMDKTNPTSFRLIGQRRMNGKLLSFKQYFGLEIFLEPLPGDTLMTRKFFQKQYRMSQKCSESYKFQETSFFSFPVICFLTDLDGTSPYFVHIWFIFLEILEHHCGSFFQSSLRIKE